MRRMFRVALAFCGVASGLAGCQHPSVSAVSLNPRHCDHHFAFLYDPCKEPEGIPFYLPKPLLIISKNFRNIEETKVGLTDGAPIPNFFDDQAKYADLNARTNFSGLDGNAAAGTPATTSGAQTFPTAAGKDLATAAPSTIYSKTGAPITPGVAPSDGLKPETFYTYHIIFVPDLTQKYGLKIKGGAGEIRAAMNLVNGWQFTGLGPYYMKDSSTAQNTLAGGITANLAASGVANVVKATAGLRGAGGGKPQGGDAPPDKQDSEKAKDMSIEKAQALVDMIQKLRPSFVPIANFAEISIYEPFLSPEGTMEWKLIAEKQYTREVLGTSLDEGQLAKVLSSVPELNFLKGAGGIQSGSVPPPPADQGAFGTGNAPVAPGVPVPPIQETPPTSFLSPMSTSPPRRRPGEAKPAVPPGSRTALAPTVPLRRSSVRSDIDIKEDVGLIRTQVTVPVGSMRLATATDSGTLGDKITSSVNPTFEVTGAPSNADLLLLRDNVQVNKIRTGIGPVGAIAISDNQAGAVRPGIYQYVIVEQAAGELPRQLATLPLQVTAPEAQAQAAATRAAVAPVAAANDREMLRQVLATGGLGVSQGVIGAVPSAGTLPVVPVSTPTATNQVNLHQYFGKTRGGGVVAAGVARKPFALFHHKDKSRPVIRTLDVDGLSAEAFSTGPIDPITSAPTTTPPSTTATVVGAGSGAAATTTLPTPVTVPAIVR